MGVSARSGGSGLWFTPTLTPALDLVAPSSLTQTPAEKPAPQPLLTLHCQGTGGEGAFLTFAYRNLASSPGWRMEPWEV